MIDLLGTLIKIAEIAPAKTGKIGCVSQRQLGYLRDRGLIGKSAGVWFLEEAGIQLLRDHVDTTQVQIDRLVERRRRVIAALSRSVTVRADIRMGRKP